MADEINAGRAPSWRPERGTDQRTVRLLDLWRAKKRGTVKDSCPIGNCRPLLTSAVSHSSPVSKQSVLGGFERRSSPVASLLEPWLELSWYVRNLAFSRVAKSGDIVSPQCHLTVSRRHPRHTRHKPTQPCQVVLPLYSTVPNSASPAIAWFRLNVIPHVPSLSC